MFETAQWAQFSKSAASLAQMAARSAKSSPQLGGLVRERQDLVDDLIAGKHLLIMPSGALTQLPFQILVTEPPRTAMPDGLDEYRVAAWLGARQPLTLLPAVSSLKALRRVGRPSAAPRPMIGFGNPLLDGYPGRPDDSPIARKLVGEGAAGQ